LGRFETPAAPIITPQTALELVRTTATAALPVFRYYGNSVGIAGLVYAKDQGGFSMTPISQIRLEQNATGPPQGTFASINARGIPPIILSTTGSCT
jgi:hypothetical protein